MIWSETYIIRATCDGTEHHGSGTMHGEFLAKNHGEAIATAT